MLLEKVRNDRTLLANRYKIIDGIDEGIEFESLQYKEGEILKWVVR